MVKKKLIKKICSIFLAFVFLMPLIFFVGCDAENDEEKPCLVLTYKPYASKSAGLLSKTYGEELYNNFLDISKDVLSGLVDAYGQGSFESGILATRANPSLNNVDIGSMLGNNSMLEVEQKSHAQKINEMIYASYSSKFTIEGVGEYDYESLTISKDGSGLTIADICSFIVGLNPADAVLKAAIEALGFDLPDLDFVYIGSGEYILRTDNAFIFIGGKVGSYNYSPAGDYSNTINFIKRLMNTNFNVIEKDLVGINGSFSEDGNFVDLDFARWNYNLFGGDSSKFFTYSNVSPTVVDGGYLNAFLEEYLLDFAVEVARVKLVGDGELPDYEVEVVNDDIPSNFTITAGNYNPKSMYTSATGDSENDKKKFLELASVFCDHKGLTEDEAKLLYDLIKKQVIGTSNVQRSEGNNYTKNNYDKYIKFGTFTEGSDEKDSVLKTAQDKNKEEVILEFYKKENSSTIEDYEIDGYLRSVIFYVKGDVEKGVGLFSMEIKESRPSSLDFLLMVRCYDGENFDKGYYTELTESLDKNKSFGFDIPAVIEKNVIKKFSGGIDKKDFVYDRNEFEKDDGEYYQGWYYKNNDGKTFIEFVFANPNLFCLQYFHIEYLCVGI